MGGYGLDLFYLRNLLEMFNTGKEQKQMKAIVKELLDEGKSTKEICKELGMKPEEVFRLSDFTREDFLKIMIKDQKTYNKSYQVKNFK